MKSHKRQYTVLSSITLYGFFNFLHVIAYMLRARRGEHNYVHMVLPLKKK